MTTEEAGRVLTVLQAAFPHPPLTADRLRLYGAKLAPLDFQAATKAVDALTDDLDYFPTVAQLKKAVDAATPPKPALPAGKPSDQPRRWLFRVWDVDADDYREFADPIPDTDDRYAVELKASRDRLRGMA